MKTITFMKWAVFTALLLLVRIWLSQNLGFLFLIWNLFLAALPLYFALRAKATKDLKSQTVWLLLALLFLPNAPYLVTDLFHLHKIQNIPQWLDLVLLFNFSMMGIVLFVLAWQRIYAIVEERVQSSLLLLVIKLNHLFICGYGIYLGRYLRFNSWDVLTQPYALIREMYGSIFWPQHAKETIAISLTFGVLLYLILELFEHNQPSKLSSHYELFEKKKPSL